MRRAARLNGCGAEGTLSCQGVTLTCQHGGLPGTRAGRTLRLSRLLTSQGRAARRVSGYRRLRDLLGQGLQRGRVLQPLKLSGDEALLPF